MNIVVVRPPENPEQNKQLIFSVNKRIGDRVRSRVLVVHASDVSHKTCHSLAAKLGVNVAVESRLRGTKEGINQMIEEYGSPRRLNTLIILTSSDTVIDHVVKSRVKGVGMSQSAGSVVLPPKAFIHINGLGDSSCVGF